MKRVQLNTTIYPMPQVGSIQGIFLGVVPLTDFEGQPKLNKFGMPLEYFTLKDEKTGEEKQYWMNGGLRGALKMARAKTETLLEIEATGETNDHPDWGTPMPVYNIYALTN